MAYTEEQIKILKDMRAFLDYCMTIDDVLTFEGIMSTLMHDSGGILRKEKCFSPRSYGFEDGRPSWESYAISKGLEVKR